MSLQKKPSLRFFLRETSQIIKKLQESCCKGEADLSDVTRLSDHIELLAPEASQEKVAALIDDLVALRSQIESGGADITGLVESVAKLPRRRWELLEGEVAAEEVDYYRTVLLLTLAWEGRPLHQYVFKPTKLEWLTHNLRYEEVLPMNTLACHHYGGTNYHLAEEYGFLPLSATHGSLRSLLSYKIAQRFGLKMVPETFIVCYQGGYGTLQEFVLGEPLFYDRQAFLQPIAGETLVEAQLRSLQEQQALMKQQVQQLRSDQSEQQHSPLPPWIAAAAEQLLYWKDQCDHLATQEKLIQAQQATIPQQEILHIPEIDLSSPALRQQLIQAQMLDYLCGQVDRPSLNMRFEGDRLSLIDNDHSFIPQHDPPVPPFPQCVDATLAERMMELSTEELRIMLTGLSHREIEAALGRLKKLQCYFEELSRDQEKRGLYWIKQWDQLTPSQQEELEYAPAYQEGNNYWTICNYFQESAKRMKKYQESMVKSRR